MVTGNGKNLVSTTTTTTTTTPMTTTTKYYHYYYYDGYDDDDDYYYYYKVTSLARVETKIKVQHAVWKPVACSMRSMQAKQAAVCSHASLQLHHAACRGSHLQHATLQT